MNDLAQLGAIRLRMMRNHLRSLGGHSRLKLAFISCFAVALWGGMFLGFHEGFDFLNQRNIVDFKPLVVNVLFALFFMSLMLMLLFSNGIISFTSLFRSEESAFLFANPVRPESIFLYKLFESLMFSSWAFLFLGAPLIFAYGVTSAAPWYFYPAALLFFGVFVFIPAGLAALVTIVIATYFAHSRRRVAVLLFLTATLIVLVWGSGLLRDLRLGLTQAPELWMRNVLGKLAWCQNPILPSRWISDGVLALGRGETREVRFNFLLLLSNALFIMMIARWAAGRCYRKGYHRLASAAGRRRRYGDGLFDRALWYVLLPLSPATRLLIIKDIKSFRRDPVQWSQVLIFFGLLAVYLLNMRRLRYHVDMPYWKNLVSFLNLAAVSLTLSTFTSRFIFPLLSLEGRRFWVLGLLPLPRRRILLGKFLFAFGGSLVMSEGLMVLSDLMLKVSAPMMLLHCFAMFVICAGLSALSVGLGALFPSLREENPSKIVSSFGGTLNLLLSILLVFSIIALFAAPCHFYFVRKPGVISAEVFADWIKRAVAAALLIGAAACAVPLYLGQRAFAKMEV